MTAPLAIRAWQTLRETGLRGVWFKLLAGLGYRRLYVLRRALSEPIPGGPSPPVSIDWLAPASVRDYLAMLPSADAAEIAARLAAGDRCLVARRQGRIIGSMWGSRTRAVSDWLGRELPLAADEAYQFDAYTSPSWRGLGIAPALSLAWLKLLREEGCAAAVRMTLPENVAALRAHAKAGYRIVAVVRSLRLGSWRYDFPVKPLSTSTRGMIPATLRTPPVD